MITTFYYNQHKQILADYRPAEALIMAAYRRSSPEYQDILTKAFPVIIEELLEGLLLEIKGLPLDQHLVPEVREPGREGEA